MNNIISLVNEVHSWYKNSPFAVEEGRLSLAGDPFGAMFKDPVDLECWIPNMFSESLVSLLGILLSAKSWKVLPNLILFVLIVCIYCCSLNIMGTYECFRWASMNNWKFHLAKLCVPKDIAAEYKSLVKHPDPTLLREAIEFGS